MSESSRTERRLPGDVAVWLIIGLEMATFGLMFVAFAVARLREPAHFHQGQLGLDLRLGACNTALLLTGSWLAARGVLALQAGRRRPSVAMTAAAAGCGLAFLVTKGLEYAAKLDTDAVLSEDSFQLFYFMLTGFHALHVLAASVALAVVAVWAARGRWGPGAVHAPETVAAFWHMVDLMWVVLFPLVYVLR